MELLLPPEEYSKCQAANVEIIAGAGGLEAAMFARNLFDMYAAFARQHGWEFCPENGSSETDHDPIHHTNILITSPDTADSAYNRLRWEAGVHRVQRVPVTSKLNKIHTSTVAVTILPSLDDVSPYNIYSHMFSSHLKQLSRLSVKYVSITFCLLTLDECIC